VAKVLLVDDDLSLTETLQLGLRRRGYSASSSASAAEALAAMKAEDFDVVVTDLNMKGGSGIDLCTSIAECHRDVPTIVLTAFGNYETAVLAIRAGAYDFISGRAARAPRLMRRLGLEWLHRLYAERDLTVLEQRPPHDPP